MDQRIIQNFKILHHKEINHKIIFITKETKSYPKY